MACFKNFEEIKAWVKARELTRLVYKISSQTGFKADFGLQKQIRTAAVSIMSNIAEGNDRDGNKEFVNFLSIAKGSAGEVRSLLYVARDQGYIDDGIFENLKDRVSEISRMIEGLSKSIKGSGKKGRKFKD